MSRKEKSEKDNDIYGDALLDHQRGNFSENIITDSTFEKNGTYPLPYLFREFAQMPIIEQKALTLAKGRILDVGCGAGSHSLYLQEKGLEVSAIDLSKGAIETCRLRGVANAQVKDIWEFTNKKFDTILLLMNGAGMCGTLKKLPEFLTHLKGLLAENGQILLDSTDVIYMYEDEDGDFVIDGNKAYYGETTFTMTYKNKKSQSFDWLYVDFNTLQRVAEDCHLQCDLITEGPHYDFLARIQF